MTPLGEYSGLASTWPSELVFTTFAWWGRRVERGDGVCISARRVLTYASSYGLDAGVHANVDVIFNEGMAHGGGYETPTRTNHHGAI